MPSGVVCPNCRQFVAFESLRPDDGGCARCVGRTSLAPPSADVTAEMDAVEIGIEAVRCEGDCGSCFAANDPRLVQIGKRKLCPKCRADNLKQFGLYDASTDNPDGFTLSGVIHEFLTAQS